MFPPAVETRDNAHRVMLVSVTSELVQVGEMVKLAEGPLRADVGEQ